MNDQLLSDYAALSQNVYNKKPGVASFDDTPIPPGWQRDQTLNSSIDEFTAAVYQSTTPGSKNIVIAFAGTDLNSTSDKLADIGLATGVGIAALFPPSLLSPTVTQGLSQLIQAVELYDSVERAYPGYTISFTGHSLGGGLAALCGVLFNKARHYQANTPYITTVRESDNANPRIYSLLLAHAGSST